VEIANKFFIFRFLPFLLKKTNAWWWKLRTYNMAKINSTLHATWDLMFSIGITWFVYVQKKCKICVVYKYTFKQNMSFENRHSKLCVILF